MFTRVKPQWVRHSDGFDVYILDRARAAYEDSECWCAVEMDTGSTFAIYSKTLKCMTREKVEFIPDSDKVEVFVSRIKTGLEAMGVAVVCVD